MSLAQAPALSLPAVRNRFTSNVPASGTDIVTEASDALITEAGDNLITE